MPVADLYNVPTTPEQLAKWSFSHLANHRDQAEAVQRLYGLSVPVYVIDPLDPKNASTFLYQHQIMHNTNDAITGVSGYDLTDVDLSDPEQMASWILLNAQLHFAEAQVLGTW